MKVMIVVTHLLGSGHLSRALTLARAFEQTGHDVRVVSGGMPVPHLDRGDVPIVQLPPLRSDGVAFTRLLDAEGDLVSDAYLKRRETALLAQLATAPDVIITELFPFGRRVLRAEFTALLNAAKSLPKPPLICASIRDILAPPSKPEKAAKTDALIADYYDAVLVHSDPDVTPLSASWPVSDTLAPYLRYTGFVAPPAAAPHPDQAGQDEIIVSAGGGDVGQALFEMALEAATGSPHPWRLLVGGKDAPARVAALRALAPANAIVEPARSDFRQLLHHAAASVSMCGYNTALDLLQSGCRAVFVPFDAGNEVEQTLRATALARLSGMTVLSSADLTAQTLLASLADVLNAPARAPLETGLDGAMQTVAHVTQLREGQP